MGSNFCPILQKFNLRYLVTKFFPYTLFLLLIYCEKLSMESDALEHKMKPEQLNGVWAEYHTKQVTKTNFEFTGSYIKFKVEPNKVRIWHLYGSDLRLEEYSKLNCLDYKCSLGDKLGDYDHFFMTSIFTFDKNENFLISDPYGNFPINERSKYKRIDKLKDALNEHPMLNAMLEQAELDLPEATTSQMKTGQ